MTGPRGEATVPPPGTALPAPPAAVAVAALSASRRIGAGHLAGAAGTGLVLIAVVGLVLELFIRPTDSGAWYDLARTTTLVLAALGAAPAGYIAYRRQLTLEAQRELDAGRQVLAESAEGRLQLAETQRQLELAAADARSDRQQLRTRYSDAAVQLGSTNAAMRLAGVYAMAQLADDWGETETSQRQTCINVLCAYLRMPTEPGNPAAPPSVVDAEGQVRAAVHEVIYEHIRTDRDPGRPEWCTLNFDLHGATLINLTFNSVEISGTVRFDAAVFTGDRTTFEASTFSGRYTTFSGAKFLADRTTFEEITFAGKEVTFAAAQFAGDEILFVRGQFYSDRTLLNRIVSSTKHLSFDHAEFHGASTVISGTFDGGAVVFQDTRFMASSTTTLDGVTFAGQSTTFEGAEFSGGQTSMLNALFKSKETSFRECRFGARRTIAANARYVHDLIVGDGSIRTAQNPSSLSDVLGLG